MSSKFLNLLHRKWVRYGLVITIAGVMFLLMLRSLGTFLAVNRKAQAEILVVEGWVPDNVIRDAISEFNHGGYKLLITTGGPIQREDKWSGFKTSAEFAAANLAAMGFETNKLIAVPAPETARDRTYTAGLALKSWLNSTNTSFKACNVYTVGAHARRTRLMFEQALGRNITVGIIAHPDIFYDATHWWATMGGFTTVTSETIAYLYARLVFPFVCSESVDPPISKSRVASSN